MDWGQERQAAKGIRQGRPALNSPHQSSGDPLKGEQHIEQTNICHLLKRIEFLFRCLFIRMVFSLEDSLQVVDSLGDGAVKEPLWLGDILFNLSTCQVIEAG